MSLLATTVRVAGRLTVVLIAAVTLSATLSGCVSSGQSGPPMASLKTIGPPPAGQARIIVMRPEKGFYGWGDRALPVKIDGEPVGELLTGQYLSVDRRPGRHQISAELWDHPGTSRHDVNAAAGRVYYFAARVKQKVNDVHAAAAFGGLVGYAIVAAATDDNSGPIALTPMSEAEARRAIAEAR
jgi:outer membrane murein-binding lipoprotein Lpp